MSRWKWEPIKYDGSAPQPDNRPIGKAKNGLTLYRLYETFVADFWVKERGAWHRYKIIVKKGLLNDGSSFPWFVRKIWDVSQDGLHRAAAILHDALFRAKGKWSEHLEIYRDGEPATLTFQQSNALYVGVWYDCGGCTKARAQLAYMGLQVGGRLHWGGPCPAMR